MIYTSKEFFESISLRCSFILASLVKPVLAVPLGETPRIRTHELDGNSKGWSEPGTTTLDFGHVTMDESNGGAGFIIRDFDGNIIIVCVKVLQGFSVTDD